MPAWLVALAAVLTAAAPLVVAYLRYGRRPPRPPVLAPPPPRIIHVPEPSPSERERVSRPPVDRVLVVEDDPSTARVIVRGLRSDLDDVDVLLAETGAEALTFVRAERFDLLVVDVLLHGGMSGNELVRRLRFEGSAWSQVPVILMSGLDPSALAKLAEDCDATATWSKDGDLKALVAIARRLLRRA